MKIRSGFVSNSSSSSFIIISDEMFPNVRSVAEYIINTADDDHNILYKNKKDILYKLELDAPVYFNTFGDDTYIHKIEDKIIIQTSQNLDLYHISDRCISSNQLSNDFFEQFNYTNEYKEEYIFDSPRDFHGFYHNLNDFINLDNGNGKLIGSHTYIDKCTKCSRFNRGWRLKSGKVICECQINDHVKIIDRKDKLKKIKNNK